MSSIILEAIYASVKLANKICSQRAVTGKLFLELPDS